MDAATHPAVMTPLLDAIGAIEQGTCSWQSWNERAPMDRIATGIAERFEQTPGRGLREPHMRSIALNTAMAASNVGPLGIEQIHVSLRRTERHLFVTANLHSNESWTFETTVHAPTDLEAQFHTLRDLSPEGHAGFAREAILRTCALAAACSRRIARTAARGEAFTLYERTGAILEAALVVAADARPDLLRKDFFDVDRSTLWGASTRPTGDGGQSIVLYESNDAKDLAVIPAVPELAPHLPTAFVTFARAGTSTEAGGGDLDIVRHTLKMGEPLIVKMDDIDAEPIRQAQMIRTLPAGQAEAIVAAMKALP